MKKTDLGYNKNIHIYVCSDYEELSGVAADIVANEIKKNPSLTLGLATGSSPVGLYKNLIKAYKDGKIDFSKVHSYNLDEYYPISPENDQSYRYFMNENLFDGVNIDKSKTCVPDGLTKDIEAMCAAYDAHIAKTPAAVQVLGIGGNGHIGFNEPCGEFIENTHKVELTKETIEANARFFASVDDVPKHAVTMGMGGIMSAEKILLVANGEGKANAVAAMLKGPIEPKCPASLLRLHKDVHVVIDASAAKYL